MLAGCASPEPPTAAPVEDGKGPAWSFRALDGSTQSRDSPAANATVIFFMATWCGSCRSKAPVLAEVQDAYAGTDVRILSLDFDPTESEADVAAWQERYRQDWPHGLDTGLTIQRAFGVKTQSSVLVLDGNGNAVKLFGYGTVTRDALTSAIESARVA